MKLPNHQSALIVEHKITAYLLSEENSGGKAAFFVTFDFTITHPGTLRAALLQHAAAHEVTHISETPQLVCSLCHTRIVADDVQLLR